MLLTRGNVSLQDRFPMMTLESWCNSNAESELWLWIKDAVRVDPLAILALRGKGCRIHIFNYSLENVLAGTPLERFIDGSRPGGVDRKKLTMGKHWYSHETDFFRLAALWKYGGWYTDFDMVFLRSAHCWHNAIAQESKSYLNNALSHFDAFHPFLYVAMRTLVSMYSPRQWGSAGPRLVTFVFKSYGKKRKRSRGLPDAVGPFGTFGHVRKIPSYLVMPCPWTKSSALYREDGAQTSRFAKYLNTSIAFHAWHRMASRTVSEKGSIIQAAYRKACVVCNVSH